MAAALPGEAFLEALYPEGHQVQTLHGYHLSADAHAPSLATVLHDATPVPLPPSAEPRTGR